MKPSAPRPSRLLSRGRGPNTKAETASPLVNVQVNVQVRVLLLLQGDPSVAALRAETLDQQVQSRQPPPCR
jgi:hypothetical protein